MYRSAAEPIESLETRTLFSSTLAWKSVAPMPIPRAEGASFVADGKLYCFGGFDNATTLTISNEMDAYDPVTDTWTRMADCPVKVNDNPVTMDAVTDTAWCGGFFLNDGYHASGLMYAYHVKTNTWTQGPSLPYNVGAGQMGVVGRELYYFGGRNSANIGQTTTYMLNLDDPNATWQTTTPMPYTANHDGAVVLNNKIYAVGGIVNKEEDNGNEAYVQVFDPSTATWTQAAPMPFGIGHIASAVTLADGDIIVCGGQIDGSNQVMDNEVLQYDPAANSWTHLTNLPTYRVSSFVGYVDGELIVTGGNMYNSPYINTITWVAAYSNSTAVVTPPTVTIGNATAQAGNDIEFTATLSAVSTSAVTASYTLTPGTAVSADFNSIGGTLTIPAGQTQATIEVPTYADTSGAEEDFTLTLGSLSSNATFANGQTTESATGTIKAVPAIIVPPPPPATPATTTISLEESAGTLVAGQSNVFTVIVSSEHAVPSGAVAIWEDGSELGSYPINADGQAVVSLAAAMTGTFTATYAGNDSFAGSTSNAVSETVLPISPVAPVAGKSIVPITAIAGQSFSVSIPLVLTNTGKTEKGKFTLAVYADTASTGLTEDAVLISTSKKNLSLGAGKSARLPSALKQLPTSLAAGDYHLVTVITDPAGNYSMLTSAQTVNVAVPKLTVSAIVGTTSPATIKPGRSGIVSVSLTNTGNIPAKGSLEVQIMDSSGDGIVLATLKGRTSIKPGRTVHYRMRVRIPKSAVAGAIYPVATISFVGVSMSVTSASAIVVA